jgi:hypothetical protein
MNNSFERTFCGGEDNNKMPNLQNFCDYITAPTLFNGADVVSVSNSLA